MKASNLKMQLVLSCVISTLGTACAKYNFSPIAVEEAPAATTQDPGNGATTAKTITTTEVVAYGNKQVDFLLVLDDSNSMLPELKKLAARMSTFVNSLDASNIDWQMCITTTRGVNSAGKLVYGTPLNWANYTPATGTPAYLLKKGTANLNSVFTSTVDSLAIGGANSGDERAIRAAHDNFAAQSQNCYRPGAAISVIAISDEDERSVGGDPKKVKAKDNSAAYQPLEPEDQPSALVAQAKSTFGDDVRFTFSSIIVKPGDASCEAEQDTDTSPSHPGYLYEEVSKLTDGGVGSICDADYSANLNTFKDKIVNSLSSLNLQCDPKPESLKVKVEGSAVAGTKLDGKTLKFAYPLIEGTKIDLSYDCKD